MSAKISNLVTADSNARAALTIDPLFIDEQGSSEKSLDARRMSSPDKSKLLIISFHF